MRNLLRPLRNIICVLIFALILNVILILIPVFATSHLSIMDIKVLPASTDTELEWNMTFGGEDADWGYSVIQTSDGGFAIIGVTRSLGAGEYDVYLIKTDEFGNEQWHRAFGGSGWDWGYSLEQTSDDGFIIAGVTSSSGEGMYDVYLIKTDASGNKQWSNTFGGSDLDRGYSVHQTSDDGFIIAGVTSSFGAGGKDVYLIKTSTSGNKQWSNTFGGADDEEVFSVKQMSDGGFIAVGYTKSFGAGDSDVYLIRTDESGSELWRETYGGAKDDEGYSVLETSDGGFIIAGVTGSVGISKDVYVIKTNSTGGEEWFRTFGGEEDDEGSSIKQTADNGFIIAGVSSSPSSDGLNIFLIKTDEVGSDIWNRTFGGTDWDTGRSILQTSDGDFIITGGTASFDADGDVYLMKVSAEIWSDRKNPSISITSPLNGQHFHNSVVIIRGNASDNIDLRHVDVKVNDGSWQTASGITLWDAEVTLGYGSSTIYARATDTSGNIGEASVTVSYSLPTTIPTWLIVVIVSSVLLGLSSGLFWAYRRARNRRKMNTQIDELEADLKTKIEKWRGQGRDVSELEDLFR